MIQYDERRAILFYYNMNYDDILNVRFYIINAEMGYNR